MASITVAGQGVVALNRRIAEFLRDLGEEPAKLNRVDWPAGASRPARGGFVITESTHQALLALDLSVPIEVIMDDGRGGRVVIDRMYQTAHRPIHLGGDEGLYELQLADERHLWLMQTASAKGYNITLQSDREKRYDDTEKSSDTAHTWSDVIGALMDDLGASDRTIEVPVGTGKDNPTDVHTQGANAAEMVDRIASAVGLMLFADYAGTTPRYSVARPDTEQSLPPDSEQMAGGIERPGEGVGQGQAWRDAVMPGQVRVLFPRHRPYTEDEATADQPAVKQFSEYTSSSGAPSDGRPGFEAVVYDGTWAIASAATPTSDSNSSALQDRADYLANRYYQRWRVQHLQGRYRGWIDNGPVPGTVSWRQTPAGPVTEFDLSQDLSLYGGDRPVIGEPAPRIRASGSIQVWQKWWGETVIGSHNDAGLNAIITGKTAATGDRHTYTIKFAEKSAAGYGNWQAKSGATAKTAFNREEEVDPGTYIDKDPDGDGKNEVTIDGVPVGTPVLISRERDGAGGTEWWFSAAVQVTVSC